MTDEKILEVVERYRNLFETLDIAQIDYPHDQMLDSPEYEMSLGHCHGMLDKIVDYIRNGRRDKAFRWLGFVQGVLFVNKIFTIGDLANHNRPTETQEVEKDGTDEKSCT